jgi:hypothetical protein
MKHYLFYNRGTANPDAWYFVPVYKAFEGVFRGIYLKFMATSAEALLLVIFICFIRKIVRVGGYNT